MEGIRKDGESTNRVAAPLMMGIAYAANIGGLGTPIGTTPNLVFIDQYEEFAGITMTFSGWMKFGIPVVVTMIPLMWVWLSRGLGGARKIRLPDCGPWRPGERRTLMVFGFTALAWMTRAEPWGGWSSWLGLTTANDASVAFVGVLLLFILPDGSGREGEAGRLLDWKTASQIPWGILLLFSGGICLASGIKESGLSAMAAGVFSGLGGLPVLGMIVAVCLVMTFLTEMTSNTASTILMMPILGAAALAAEINPLLLMLPAALSASCAFMLPVATGPNAVVFGSGHLTVPKMAREGVVLNLMGAVVVTFWLWLLAA